MRQTKHLKGFFFLILFSFIINITSAQTKKLTVQAKESMLKATRFMVEEVSYNGGYVWYYLPDFSRRWGEMEACKTMIWVQNPGTVTMGDSFLDAYETTGNPYYYEAAKKVAAALIWGQSHQGGWNYMIDFGGDRSLKKWYNTIGKNGWRLEEFQHYYGNSTFDDGVTSGAARYLLRMYMTKLDPTYKPALDKAINFILESQYPLGGWPQRYPLKFDYSKNGNADYSSYYTLNDDVTWDNIQFLIQCYVLLGEQRFLDPIRRAMNFYLVAQNGSGGWSQQLNMELKAASARTYEPAGLLPSATFKNCMLLLKFYEFSGERKFLLAIPPAIEWLEQNQLPEDQTQEGKYTHPAFIDPETGDPIYVHRTGSNVKYGHYYTDQNDEKLLRHYGGKTYIPLDFLKKEYKRIASLSPDEAIANSPLNESGEYGIEILKGLTEQRSIRDRNDSLKKRVDEIIQSLDDKGRWLVEHAMVSNPYIGEGQKIEQTDEFVSTMVGDNSDTSPYLDESDQMYISTRQYIRNMKLLMEYLKKEN
jgi:hypothetical protein